MRPFCPAACSFVAVLLGARGPRAIIGRVIKIIILAVNRVVGRWPCAHVSKKIGERFLPSLTDPNPTPSPIPISGVVRILAAIFHPRPDPIFRTTPRATCSSMGYSRPAAHIQLPPETAATSRVPAAQFVGGDDAFLSALANAVPTSPGAFIAGDNFPEHGQAFKRLASEITKVDFSHDRRIAVTLPAMVVHGAQALAVTIASAFFNAANSLRHDWINCSLICVSQEMQ